MTTAHHEGIAAFLPSTQGFSGVTGPLPRLEEIAGAEAHEGPVYVPAEDALYVTSTPNAAHRSTILRVDLGSGTVTPVRSGTTAANGMALAPDGRRLIVCDQGSLSARAAISRVDPATGETQVLVDALGKLPLNSPNDVAVAADGTLWFTDPGYGWLQGFRPRPQLGDHVYCYDPRRQRLAVVADGFDKPNGLVFAPDGSVLYVGDSGADRGTGVYEPARPHHVIAFDVSARKLSNRRIFALIEPGAPDGLDVWLGLATSVQQRLRAELVGRERERAQLANSLDDAHGGDGRGPMSSPAWTEGASCLRADRLIRLISRQPGSNR